MARRSRRATPEPVVLDVERGHGETPGVKQAALVPEAIDSGRETQRSRVRGLDEAREAMVGATRQRRDRDRSVPRGVAGEVPDARMVRGLPDPGEIREPMSARQRNARSSHKRRVQDELPTTQLDAVRGVVTDSARWAETNRALSRAAGDVQRLPAAQRAAVQRVDRAVQAYERGNDRGHRVYTTVRMPGSVSPQALSGYVERHLPVGRVVTFDGFVLGAHTVHELDGGGGDGDRERSTVFEIQSRRGMYLGGSNRVDNTAHLLPRGMRLRVAGSHTASYRRPDGTLGTRQVVSLTDVDDDTKEND